VSQGEDGHKKGGKSHDGCDWLASGLKFDSCWQSEVESA